MISDRVVLINNHSCLEILFPPPTPPTPPTCFVSSMAVAETVSTWSLTISLAKLF